MSLTGNYSLDADDHLQSHSQDGGTFLIDKLRRTHLLGGPFVVFSSGQDKAPRVYFNREFRPGLLVYHVSGMKFAAAYQRHPGDFVFTFLRNRVDMVYSNYTYMNKRITRGDMLPGWTKTMCSYYWISLEQHIDLLLANDRPDREYPTTLHSYDFVGITEEMKRSLLILNQKLGTSLVDDGAINTVPSIKTYRRAELEQKFSRQLELYEYARAKLGL